MFRGYQNGGNHSLEGGTVESQVDLSAETIQIQISGIAVPQSSR